MLSPQWHEQGHSHSKIYFRVWKDLTLSSNADQSRYRVWDYPIKEQYTHLYKTIQASGLAKDAEDGFNRVLADEEGTFAFIHDASEVPLTIFVGDMVS